MHSVLKKHDERGYTLFESMFQLVIFFAFVQLFILFFYWKAPIENQYENMSNTAWEMFAVDFQSSISNVYDFKVHKDHRGIYVLTDRGHIDIEHRNAVIRKKVDGLGHSPFLTGVYSAYFTLEGMTVFVDVTMLDGTRKERNFAIGLNPK